MVVYVLCMMYFGELDYLMISFADCNGVSRFSHHISPESMEYIGILQAGDRVDMSSDNGKLYANLTFPYWPYSAAYLTPLEEAVTQE